MQKENAENLKRILAIIRNATKAIKIFPFVYILILLIVLPLMSYMEVDTATIVSGCVYLSPLLIAFLILLSYCVRLCFWHRLQCALPLVPQIVDFIDSHLYEYGEALATLNFAILIFLFVASLVNAFFVFIRPTRKPRT